MHWLYLMTSLIVAFTAPLLIFFPQLQPALRTDSLTGLYGREKEQRELLDAIFVGNKVIDVVGIVGVGKTTFVQSTTDILVEKYGYCALYIDVSEYADVSAVITHLLSNHQCISIHYSLFLTFKELCFGLDTLFKSWLKYLKPHIILTFDNADAMMNEIDQNIIQLFSVPQSTIIQVSRRSNMNYLMRPVIQLKGMDYEICARWITSECNLITFEAGVALCDELGGVPHEVKTIAVYASHPLTAGSVDDVVNELKSQEYGRPFMYVESILGTNYKETEHRSKAMYFLYDRLDDEHRVCIWLLENMTGNRSFTRNIAIEHLAAVNISVDNCLDALLRHSFLESTLGAQKTYKFRSYVTKFIEYLGQPLHDPRNSSKKRKHLLCNFMHNQAKARFNELKRTQNLTLAVEIGSNRELINSFLPKLGCGYELKPLFKLAYKVIEEHFCTPNSALNSSNAKALLAFTYLIKSLHCPSFHAPALLLPSEPKLVQSDSCLQKLVSCDTIVSIKDSNYETAEALGYYNSLLIYAYDSVPWHVFLTDLSYIVIVADHECVHYCTNINFCECGRNSTIENGLQQFILKKYVLSVQFFEATLNELSDINQQCQTVLKLIAIAGIYASKSNNSTRFAGYYHYLNDINFHNVNVTCYLGVFSDLIIPFLLEIKHEMVNDLMEQLNKLVHVEQTICTKKQTEKEDVDCSPKTRYIGAKGTTALRMTELQKRLKWPEEVTEYDSREEWVCAIIRDKITKCKEDLPLFSLVGPLETKMNIKNLQILKEFMETDKFD